MSGAEAPGGRGHGPGFVECCGEGPGQWDACARHSGGLGFLLGLRKDAGSTSFLLCIWGHLLRH